ncbi:metal ABC transporter permease [Alicyclobacillus sp. SO9]|uniref:metal ABC transporter permease n=1 Tax=Alicyclobacillus sp. SO9 TaxID=2665646 RepID=UPI0018E89D21|nr:metal ABC transporter permease [Alicyclobacillus sp. SO9]QQE78060.1 metal ABC transporter permease [Alicyclobacillus sp. SO9]
MMTVILHSLADPAVIRALWLGALIALTSAVAGVFVIIRGQSFAGHVLTDIGVTGASGAYLIGQSAWYGFIGFGIMAGAGIEAIGDKIRNRDIATGIALSFSLGIGALFLYLDTRIAGGASAAQLVLFGSLFAVQSKLVPLIALVSLVSLILIGVLYRPLLLSSLSPEVAAAKGVSVRIMSLLFMLALAITVENSALVIGALMSTALLIGPASAAVHLTRRPHRALFLAGLIGVLILCAGVVLADMSVFFPPRGQGWPVSFFIAVLVFLVVLMTSLFTRSRNGRRGLRKHSSREDDLAQDNKSDSSHDHARDNIQDANSNHGLSGNGLQQEGSQ